MRLEEQNNSIDYPGGVHIWWDRTPVPGAVYALQYALAECSR